MDGGMRAANGGETKVKAVQQTTGGGVKSGTGAAANKARRGLKRL